MTTHMLQATFGLEVVVPANQLRGFQAVTVVPEPNLSAHPMLSSQVGDEVSFTCVPRLQLQT